jgi:hypothetical protein
MVPQAQHPNTARATSSCVNGPLLNSDLDAFEYVAVINPAAGVLGRVMEGMLALVWAHLRLAAVNTKKRSLGDV